MSTPFPESCLTTSGLLLETHLAMSGAIRTRAVEPLGLDADTADLIVRLSMAGDGGLRGGDIARQLYISAVKASRLIDRAERDGYVVRRNDPTDRRAQLVQLTEKGEQAAKAFAPPLLEVIDETVHATFSAAELRRFESYLAKLRDAAQVLAASP